MNKYYTPSIEDIRIGYEGQFHNISMDERGKEELNYDRWDTTTLNNSHVEIMLKYGIKNFKIPYLTKEQIEAEGWNHIGGQLTSVGRQNFEKIVGIRGFCELQYTPLNQKLKIEQRNHVRDGSGDYTLLTIYDGYCPSINELRTLSKLLNINK